MPITRRRVVCGLSETIATLPPASALTSVDFPTFGRPATATNPLLKDPHPHPGWGSMPAALGGDDSRLRRTCPSRVRAECGTSALAGGALRARCRPRASVQLPRVRQQLGRRVADDLALAVPERHPVDAELVEPLAAAAARRRRDADRLEVARPAAGDDGTADRALLRAHAEGVRRVLHVHAFEDAPVPRPHGRADEVVRVGRIRALSDRDRPLVELLAHASTWKTTSVTS